MVSQQGYYHSARIVHPAIPVQKEKCTQEGLGMQRAKTLLDSSAQHIFEGWHHQDESPRKIGRIQRQFD